MINIQIKLNKSIIARTASNLVFHLTNAKAVYICKNNKCFNGKSLVGILSNNLIPNDIIKITVEREEDLQIVEEAFKDLGEVIT